MNCQRRDALRSLRADIKTIKARLEEQRDAEENALSAMPESFQFSTRGDAMQDAISGMDEAIDELQTAIERITEVVECE